MGGRDGGERVERSPDRADARHGSERHAPAVGVVELRHEADVGEAHACRRGRSGRWPGWSSIRSKASSPGPMKDCIQRFHRDRAAGGVDGVAGDAEVADRVDLHRDRIGEGAHPGAPGSVGGQEAGAAGLIEILDDRQRLRERQPVDRQRPARGPAGSGRDDPSDRCSPFVRSTGTASQSSPIRPRRDADPVARRGAPVVIEDRRHSSPCSQPRVRRSRPRRAPPRRGRVRRGAPPGRPPRSAPSRAIRPSPPPVSESATSRRSLSWPSLCTSPASSSREAARLTFDLSMSTRAWMSRTLTDPGLRQVGEHAPLGDWRSLTSAS